MSTYTLREEKANTITHLIGVVFGFLAAFILVGKAVQSNNNWILFSFLVYAVFMPFSYITSTLYHNEKKVGHKILLRKFDHAAIYLHIAGSYTPFTLVLLRNQGTWGWSLFSVIWLAAIVGVLLSFLNFKNSGKLETFCYIAMGWVVLIAIKPLAEVLSAQNSMEILWWLIAGGLFYTLGAFLYLIKKIEFMHAIWHLFVLGGSVCHAFAIYLIAQ